MNIVRRVVKDEDNFNYTKRMLHLECSHVEYRSKSPTSVGVICGRCMKAFGLVRMKEGYAGAGKIGRQIGPAIFIGQWWVPVKWRDQDDPDFVKAAALDLI